MRGEVGHRLARIRVAAANRELGQHGLRGSWTTVMPRSISPVARSASSQSPLLSRSQASAVATYETYVCTSCLSA